MNVHFMKHSNIGSIYLSQMLLVGKFDNRHRFLKFIEFRIQLKNLQLSENSFVSGEAQNVTFEECVIIQQCGCCSRWEVETHRPHTT
jgi:hypothetical protein